MKRTIFGIKSFVFFIAIAILVMPHSQPVHADSTRNKDIQDHDAQDKDIATLAWDDDLMWDDDDQDSDFQSKEETKENSMLASRYFGIGALVLTGGLAVTRYGFRMLGGARELLLSTHLGKSLAYNLSLKHVLLITREPSLLVSSSRYDRWNHVLGSNVILGMVPLSNHQHHTKLSQDYRVGAVLTLLEPFEVLPGAIATPVTSAQWSELGINHLHIHAEDFKPLPVTAFQKGVKFIQEQVALGRNVYVHCKAGVGRSASVVVAYSIVAQNSADTIRTHASAGTLMTLIEPEIRRIHAIRRINLQAPQRAAIERYLRTI